LTSISSVYITMYAAVEKERDKYNFILQNVKLDPNRTCEKKNVNIK